MKFKKRRSTFSFYYVCDFTVDIQKTTSGSNIYEMDIFVSNIPKGLECRTTSSLIKRQLGTVAQVKTIWLHHTKGFGFVTLLDKSSTDLVLTLNGKIVLNGSILRLNRYHQTRRVRKYPGRTTATIITSIQRNTNRSNNVTVYDIHGDNRGDHGDDCGDHGDNRGDHGDSCGDHGDNRGDHGDNRGDHGDSCGDHGDNRGDHGDNCGDNGDSRGDHGDKSGDHGDNCGDHGDNRGDSCGDHDGNTFNTYQSDICNIGEVHSYHTYSSYLSDVPQIDDLYKYAKPVLPRKRIQKPWKRLLSHSAVFRPQSRQPDKVEPSGRHKDRGNAPSASQIPRTISASTKTERRTTRRLSLKQNQRKIISDLRFNEVSIQEKASRQRCHIYNHAKYLCGITLDNTNNSERIITEKACGNRIPLSAPTKSGKRNKRGLIRTRNLHKLTSTLEFDNSGVTSPASFPRHVVSQIHVYDHAKYLYDMVVDNAINSESIISEIARKSGIPKSSLLLFHKGKVVCPSYPLAVGDGDNVHITVKGKGGMMEEDKGDESQEISGISADLKSLNDEKDNLVEASLTMSAVLDEARNLTPDIRILYKYLLVLFEIIGMKDNLIGFEVVGSVGECCPILSKDTASDFDVMAIALTCQAFEQNNICVPRNYWQFLMEPCISNPCYVKLRVRQKGHNFPLFKNQPSLFEYDPSFKQMYLSNAIPATIHNLIPFFKIYSIISPWFLKFALHSFTGLAHGPSFSTLFNQTYAKPYNKIDTVLSIGCPVWPNAAEEWIKRKRFHGWPSNEFISEHTKRGCYVVPVGCKECDRTYLDWRLSFVLVEQALVRNFCLVQYNCLILLKQLKTYVFQDKIGDIISSYILKTTVFWVIEESSPDIWVPTGLLATVQVCLDRLLTFVQNDFCPNYFVRTSNLLVKRYTESEKQNVLDLCRCARANTLQLLCHTPTFSTEIRMSSVKVPAARSDLETNTLSHDFLSCFIDNVASIFISQKFSSLQTTLSSAITYCEGLCSSLRKISCKSDTQLLQSNPKPLAQVELLVKRYSWTERYLRAETKELKYPCKNETPLLELSPTVDLYESVTICHLNTVAGNYSICSEILRVLILRHKYKPYVRITLPIDVGSVQQGESPSYLDYGVEAIIPTTDIFFSKFELELLSPPIQMEMFQVLRGPVCFNSTSNGNFNVVLFDPLVYACFLRFWCCVKLDQNIEQLKARDDMVWCCNLPGINNKAVAFNLLGYCHQRLEEYEDAFRAFYTALKQQPQSEVTLLYIAFLANNTLLRKIKAT